jgi:Raf kinase inhibitor-like YbhB/YbcL family protein
MQKRVGLAVFSSLAILAIGTGNWACSSSPGKTTGGTGGEEETGGSSGGDTGGKTGTTGGKSGSTGGSSGSTGGSSGSTGGSSGSTGGSSGSTGGSSGSTGGSSGSTGGSSGSTGGSSGTTDAGAPDGGMTGGSLTLNQTGGFTMMGGKLYFMSSATHFDGDHSPPLNWTGAPAAAKSFAVSLVDYSEQQAQGGKSHWVLWDIPATVTMLPADLQKASPLTMPMELAGAKQINLTGGKSYFGPGAGGSRPYRFTIWALDIEKLPNDATALNTIIRTVLPMHKVASATFEAIGPK